MTPKLRASLLKRVVRALRRAHLRIVTQGDISFGEDFIVGPRARIARGSKGSFGRRVNIGGDFVMHNHVSIGDDVMISGCVAFIGNDHEFDDSGTIQEQSLLPKSHTKLEGDNLIGFGTIIIGNVTIGRGTIVGAGSLVNSDLPPESICVGRPARVIRARRTR